MADKKKIADIFINLALWGFLNKNECGCIPVRERGEGMLETNRRRGRQRKRIERQCNALRNGGTRFYHDKEIWMLEKLDFLEILRNKSEINLVLLGVSIRDIQ